MNKLVIIGNGFDLAHGLKTSYSDFILWCLKVAYKTFKNEQTAHDVKDLVRIRKQDNTVYDRSDRMKSIDEYKKASDLINDLDKCTLKFECSCEFVEEVINDSINNWVDIEVKYFDKLKVIKDSVEVSELNKSMDEIKAQLQYYLINHISSAKKDRNITNHFKQITRTDNFAASSLMILNFNYTSTVEMYVDRRTVEINYIHGKLNENKNPIIFGYGDETDKAYKDIEDLGKNEYLDHMKSFAYLHTPNYRELFKFLEDIAFDVHIMGHSCGISDRLLFKHIFDHENFNSVQLYYYQKYETENDFFEKTQNLSRYFDLNSKHKMRTKVVPFSESKPLTPFKPQN